MERVRQFLPGRCQWLGTASDERSYSKGKLLYVTGHIQWLMATWLVRALFPGASDISVQGGKKKEGKPFEYVLLFLLFFPGLREKMA